MLNKKVLLGSLVAGTFLLPMAANAGLVNGQCYNCHTMHQTDGLNQPTDALGQDRTAVTSMLLFGDGCAGCHATGNGNNASGVEGGGTIHAPQVDDATAPNLAGYFVNAAGIDETQHNVTTDLTSMSAAAYAAPGGASTNTTCLGCHNQAGGHHGAGNTYRMLYPMGAVQSADPIFGNTQTTTPSNAATVYDSVAMNGKCASCHGTFHTAGNQGSLAGGWVRHPTDVSLADMDGLSAATYSYVGRLAASGDATAIPLGTSGTWTDTVMCITCHFSHGGPNNDLLRWGGYGAAGTQNVAGDDTQDMGCESCHSYAATLTPGM